MRRSFIYVVLSGERWAVRREGRNGVELFDRKSQAVRAATQAAQDMWTEAGVPTTVRVQLSNGSWEEDRLYGELPAA